VGEDVDARRCRRGLPPPRRGGMAKVSVSTGSAPRAAPRVAPPVATIRRPFGATEEAAWRVVEKHSVVVLGTLSKPSRDRLPFTSRSDVKGQGAVLVMPRTGVLLEFLTCETVPRLFARQAARRPAVQASRGEAAGSRLRSRAGHPANPGRRPPENAAWSRTTSAGRSPRLGRRS